MSASQIETAILGGFGKSKAVLWLQHSHMWDSKQEGLKTSV